LSYLKAHWDIVKQSIGVSTIGFDIAKSVLQVHSVNGEVAADEEMAKSQKENNLEVTGSFSL
jgi:hypothetical protein